MKKKISVFFAVIFAVGVLLTACGGDAAAKVVSATETAVVIQCSADGGTLEDALNVLQEAGELSYSGSSGEYGLYITEVNGRSADDASSEYWAIYTTLGEADGVVYSSTEYGSYDYNGTVCASASYGASGLPMIEGEIYILALETY